MSNRGNNFDYITKSGLGAMLIWNPSFRFEHGVLGKKSKLIRFFDSWGRNPVFQFSLETFAEVWGILGLLEPSDEIDRVSTLDNSTPSGAN